MTSQNQAPEANAKRDRFKRVILPRVKRAVETVALIGNGASRNYETTPEEIAWQLIGVRKALEAVEARYAKHLGAEVAPPAEPPPPLPREPLTTPVFERRVADPKRETHWRTPPHQDRIARFVADIRPEHLSTYITLLVHRLCEMSEGADPGQADG